MGEKAPKELALSVYTEFKGINRNCGKQGHKSIDCSSKRPTQNNKKKRITETLNATSVERMPGTLQEIVLNQRENRMLSQKLECLWIFSLKLT